MARKTNRPQRYEGEAGRALAAQYESMNPDDLHAWFSGRLPQTPASALDVGTGSGRDAAWLARKGFDVVAVDQSETMLKEARHRHAAPGIIWIRDRLPSLDSVVKRGMSFDVILLNAVWMHVPPPERPRAFRKLVSILKPGGLIVFALRIGGADHEDGMFPVSTDELEDLARRHGAFTEQRCRTDDRLRRPGIQWEQIALRLPDDGTGALPLLRHIILNDAKSATYKLGLLRSVARAADGATGMACHDDDTVTLPLGLIALNWLRLYKPLVEAGLPQRPGKQGLANLGFVRQGWHDIRDVPAFDLRVGRSFSGTMAAALHRAIRDAVDNLVRMPIHYMTLPGSEESILKATKGRAGRAPGSILIDQDYLARFGELRIPAHLWRSLSRHDAWVEPALVAEWVTLMDSWAVRQGRKLDRQTVDRAMKWSDPSRDVSFARDVSRQLLENGKLYCVWTGRSLTENRLDIDHCMPWAAWPCDDLWNLLPADRPVNQNRKRAKLPSAAALEDARDRICTWWETGYVSRVREQFFAEARSSLPMGPAADPDFDKLFDGLQMRRHALRTDHKIDEWTPHPERKHA